MIYERATGIMKNDAGTVLFGGCYAGMDIGKNNVAMQEVHNVGPLPAGGYTVGTLMKRDPLGPSMILIPDPANEMFGRSGFFIHLDNPAHVGFSSDGCIVCQNDNSKTANMGMPAPMMGIQKLQILNRLVAGGENKLTVQ